MPMWGQGLQHTCIIFIVVFTVYVLLVNLYGRSAMTEFTEASKLLFQVTKNRVYFSNIKVVIPRNWSTTSANKRQPGYSKLNSYISINNVPPVPQVKLGYGCGSQGEYMHLPTSFMLKEERTLYGLHENVIVHEWGHLRWGLRDEYPKAWRKIPQFYPANGEWKPNRCSQSTVGKTGIGKSCIRDTRCDTNNINTDINKNCFFCPDHNQGSDKGSIMSSQYVDSMKLFCDKDSPSVPIEQRHDNLAPNEQNKICMYKSAWEVMREHSDFLNNSPPLLKTFDAKPEYELIQNMDGHLVLVLDVSGSMAGKRIARLKQKTDFIIQNVLSTGSWLAIVKFESIAHTIMPLTQINTQADRERLKSAVPTETGGSTCIGCGIDAAIEVLESSNAGTGEIILITDGEDNAGNLTWSRQNAIESGVVIHSIAIEQQSDILLKDISMETGGGHYVYLEEGNITFGLGFAQAASASSGDVVMLASEKINMLTSSVVGFGFVIDKGLGVSTQVTVMTDDPASNALVRVEMNGPDNYTQILEQNASTISLSIPNIAKEGDYEVTVTLDSIQSIEYYVMSSPISGDVVSMSAKLADTDIDCTTGEIPILYAFVSKTLYPIFNANVTASVVADNNACFVTLADNGQDPDLIRKDGIYSAYINPDCLAPGRMSIKVKAHGTGGKTQISYALDTSDPAYTVDVETEVMDTSFERVTVTENLFVSNCSVTTVDLIPPGRVKDVTLISIEAVSPDNDEDQHVTIQWTPTGDDKIFGNASDYRIRISESFDDLLNKSISNQTSDLMLNNLELNFENDNIKARFQIEKAAIWTRMVFLSVRAVDDVGNIGEVSNILQLIVQADVEVDTKEQPAEVNVGMVVGVVVSLTVVVIIVIVGLLYYFKKPWRGKLIVRNDANISDSDILSTPKRTASRDTFNNEVFQIDIVDE